MEFHRLSIIENSEDIEIKLVDTINIVVSGGIKILELFRKMGAKSGSSQRCNDSSVLNKK